MTKTNNHKLLTGNILSFDFGEKRVGVAIGNNITNNVHPLETIETSKKIERYSKIESLLATWKPTQLIVGYPFNDDGSKSRMSSLAKKFGEKLKNKFNIPVHFVDERFSSSEAELRLKALEKNLKKRKHIIDQVAAMVILDSFFESNENNNNLFL
tara:strand:+ start:1792 stop:2256 length:465 start_codon:yes stop_codon:yes gene_type:complete